MPDTMFPVEFGASARSAALRVGGVGLLVALGAVIALLCYYGSPLAALALPVAVAFLVLSCQRPVYAVCLALLLAVAEGVQVPLLSLGQLSSTEAAFLIVACGWAWRAITGAPGVRYPQIADYPQIALILALLPGIALGVAPATVLRLLVMWSAFFLVFLTVKGFAPPDLRRVVLALGIGAGLLSAAGLVSYVQGGGAVANGGDVTGRAAYGIPDPNYYGAYLILAATPLLALVLAVRARWRWVAAAAVGLSGLALVASLSRGALLGAVLSVGVVTLAWATTRRATVAIVVVLVCLTAVNLNPLLKGSTSEVVAERLRTVTSSSQENKRPLIWARSLQLVVDEPQGVGALRFREVSGALGLTERGDALENVHNAYLNLAVELGVLGLLAYLLWNARIAWDLTVEWRRRRAETFPLVVGVSGAAAGFAFQGLTIVQYRVQTILATVFVLAGVAAAARAWPDEDVPSTIGQAAGAPSRDIDSGDRPVVETPRE